MTERSEPANPNETTPKPRELELIFLRHGQSASQEINAALTEQGRRQAEEAGERILNHVVACGGGAIKIVRSPVHRAFETGDIVEQTIERLITERKLEESVHLLTSTYKHRETLRAAGLFEKLQSLKQPNPIEYWLEHPESIPGTTPAEISKNLQTMIATMQKVTNKLPPGEKIFYIGVTHEIPEAALLKTLTGKTPTEFGGTIKNCESISVHLTAKSNELPQIEFRGQKIEVAKP